MNLILLTPGTGSYHCGMCMRDNALAREVIRQGHQAVILPMYLPLTLDEEATSPQAPMFFGGVSTFLREKVPLLRHMPRWLDTILSRPWFLKAVAGRAAKTGGPAVAGMTFSMLSGEEGNQASEIEELIQWMKTAFDGKKPDAVWLSTALQAGLARRIRAELGIPVLGFLQGEDSFLDGLGPEWSPRVWALLAERMRDADAWVAPSRYFADLMASRLQWSAAEAAARIRVIPNGMAFDGYRAEPAPSSELPPTIGYLARFVPGKGLGLLVEAFIQLKKRGRFPTLRLRCAGSMVAGDARYVETLQAKLTKAGLAHQVEWLPNVSRAEKVAFLEGLTVFSVPATYSEAFGMYVLEAMAAGVPVVLPKASAFPEIIEATGGGILFELGPNETESASRLADALEKILADPTEIQSLGQRGHTAVRLEYSVTKLADRSLALTASVSGA